MPTRSVLLASSPAILLGGACHSASKGAASGAGSGASGSTGSTGHGAGGSTNDASSSGNPASSSSISLSAKNTGTAAAPVVLGAYGTGAAPTLVGTQPIASSTFETMGANFVAPITSTPARLFFGDAEVFQARFPNANTNEGNAVVRAVAGSSTSITLDSSALMGLPVHGAEVWVRSQSWRRDRLLVTSAATSGSQVALTTSECAPSLWDRLSVLTNTTDATQTYAVGSGWLDLTGAAVAGTVTVPSFQSVALQRADLAF